MLSLCVDCVCYVCLWFDAGRCYPCVLTVSVTCACGLTSVDVPCGRERATKPPGCSQMCQLPPTCHHLHPVPHACHFGECPPCTHVCSLPLACNHLCTATCHSRPVCPSQVYSHLISVLVIPTLCNNRADPQLRGKRWKNLSL